MISNTLTQQEISLIEKFSTDIPVSISSIARELGIPIKLATLKPGISGEIRPDEDSASGFKIRINRHESKRRQRFTAAHEIGHYLLHRDLIGDGISDSVLYRSNLSNKIEAQANSLAANLLMPKNKILEYVEINSHLEEDELVKNLSNLFQVSEIAMRIRLGIE